MLLAPEAKNNICQPCPQCVVFKLSGKKMLLAMIDCLQNHQEHWAGTIKITLIVLNDLGNHHFLNSVQVVLVIKFAMFRLQFYLKYFCCGSWSLLEQTNLLRNIGKQFSFTSKKICSPVWYLEKSQTLHSLGFQPWRAKGIQKQQTQLDLNNFTPFVF